MARSWSSRDALFRPVEKTRIPERIVDAFKAKIYAGELLPGEQLPSERELIAMFGVGRSSLREALKALIYMGFIEARQGDGYFMKDAASLVNDHWTDYCLFNHIPVNEYIDARCALESEIVALAADRALPEELKAMHEMACRIAQSVGDSVKFVELDCEFHLMLARSAKNRVLLEMLNTTRKMMSEYIHRAARLPGRIARGTREHFEIVAAVEQKDPEKAADLIRVHIDTPEKSARHLSR